MTLRPYSKLPEKGIYYSRVHLARLIAAGKFPAPVEVGTGRIAWIESELEAWLAERPRRFPKAAA
jgi:prophage regulatory protein